MEYKRILKDGIHLLAGKLGTAIIGLVSLMILARILTTEEMGKYSLFLMIINFALILGLNWSDSSMVRHGREEYILSKKINKSFWARMYIFIPLILLVSIILIIFQKKITTYIGIEPGLILLIITIFILNGILNLINYIHQSADKIKRSAYVLLSQKAILLLSLGLAMLNIFKTDLTIVLILLNVSFFLAIILNLFFFDFKKIFPYELDKNYFKKIWSYSWPQLIGFPGLYVVSYIDIFVINKYMTLADVGVYNIAYNLFMNVSMIIIIIQTLFLPLLVEYRVKKNHGLIKAYIKKIPLFTVYWSLAVAVGCLISGYLIPLIFSAKYITSVHAFNILLVATIFYFVTACLLPLINAFDYMLYSQIINLIYALVNVVMDFILVPKMGIIGAAYGTLIAYFIRMILLIALVYAIRHKIILSDDKNSI